MGDRKAAIDLYNQGVMSTKDTANPDYLKHAYQLFSSACVADPTYWQAWYQAGNNNSDLNLHPAAVACWKQALQCEIDDPKERAKVLCNLGWRLHCLGRTQEAYEVSNQSVQLDPTLAFSWVNLSLIHGTLDQEVTSIECARKAYALTPDDPTVEMALAFSLLFGRQLKEGFKHFEARFRYKLKSFLQFPYPKWEGESDKTIYHVSDQGLGDTLSFARFVEAASKRSRYIHMAVQSSLLRLFTHAFIHLPNVNVIPQPCPFPQADVWSTFVSLPSALGLSDDEIRDTPHITPPLMVNPINWKAPDRKLHIGIAWAGSPLNEIDKHRNIPFTQFLDLYDVPGVQLYSLQVGPKAQELYDSGALALVRDLTPYIADVVDTLGLLSQLDLVITCESALGHICALANKECWVPYSHLGRDYRAGNLGAGMLWTPKHRFIRQGEDQKWGPVFSRIETKLLARVYRMSDASAA